MKCAKCKDSGFVQQLRDGMIDFVYCECETGQEKKIYFEEKMKYKSKQFRDSLKDIAKELEKSSIPQPTPIFKSGGLRNGIFIWEKEIQEMKNKIIDLEKELARKNEMLKLKDDLLPLVELSSTPEVGRTIFDIAVYLDELPEVRKQPFLDNLVSLSKIF